MIKTNWLKAEGENYIIIKDGIDIKTLLSKVPVEVKKIIRFGCFCFTYFYYRTFISLGYFARKKSWLNIQYQIRIKITLKLKFKYNLESSHIKPVISNITFNDVAGVDEVKMELSELVDFYKILKI